MKSRSFHDDGIEMEHIDVLIDTLYSSDELSDRVSAAVAMGQLEDSRAVEPLIQALGDDDEDVRSAAAKSLGQIGDSRAVVPLMRVLGDRLSYIWSESAHALGMIGDKEAAEAIVDYLYRYPRRRPTKENIAAFMKLFEDYTTLLLEAGTYSQSETTVGRSDPVTTYDYHLNMDAVRELCEIVSPISTNILHKLAALSDVADIVKLEHAMGTRHDRLSFEPMRRRAQIALKERGSPAYDSSAFLDQNAWRR